MAGYQATPASFAQLEVAIVCRCPVGKNIKGKQVYLRKWCHNVAPSDTDPNAHAPLANTAAILEPFVTGSGPNNLVPVDPTGGAAGGPWTIEPHLFTHQVRRGPKRKKAPVAGGVSISNLLQDLAALKTVVEALPK
jgi:hypothetical protein